MKKLVKLSVMMLVLGLVQSAAAKPVEWQVDPAHSSVAFSVKHLMITNVRGEFKSYSGKVMADKKTGKISSVEGTVQVESIDTGIAKRDDHLRSADFFDVKKHPTMKFKTKELKWNGNNLTVKADLTIKDVTKTVTFKGELLGMRVANFGQGDQARAGYNFTAKINRKDFNLNFNAILNGTAVVDDVVTLDLDLEIYRSVKN